MFLTVGLPCIRTYRSFNKDKVLKLCFLPWACLAHSSVQYMTPRSQYFRWNPLSFWIDVFTNKCILLDCPFKSNHRAAKYLDSDSAGVQFESGMLHTRVHQFFFFQIHSYPRFPITLNGPPIFFFFLASSPRGASLRKFLTVLNRSPNFIFQK